jgi:hypothetical protein
MPKAKPTQVIVHRIELQEKEREYLEQVVAGQTVKNIVVPVAIAGGIAGAGYLGYKALNAAYEWGDDVVDDLKRQYADTKKQAEAVANVSATVTDNALENSPVGGVWRVTRWMFGGSLI